MGLDLVPTGKNPPDELNVIIEIPKDAEPVKYEAFWDLVAAGRGHDADRGAWKAIHVPPSSAAAALVCEHYNIPRAMTPWEADYHMRRLLDDADPRDPNLAAAHAQVERFFQAWRGLWARYGDSGERLFLEVAAQTKPCSHPLIPDMLCLQVRELKYDDKGLN